MIVASHPVGVQVRTIREGLTFELPPRRLALLVEHKRLLTEGRGKGRRYRLPPDDVVIRPVTAQLVIKGQRARVEVCPPISPQTETIKQAVRVPIQHRPPVGYQRAFLDDDRPNETFYLRAETRQCLFETCRAPDRDLCA